MAGGGKETPRQKMVGMMYLVLTALLALQVSNSVLDKFVFIDESLKHSIEITRTGNTNLIAGIDANVKKNGNRADDMAVLARAGQAKEKTTAMLHELDMIRAKIIEVTGGNLKDDQGKDIPGSYAGAKDYDMVMNLMIGPEGNKTGIGYEMEKKMDKYRSEMQAMVDSVVLDDLTQPAKDIPQFKNNPDQKDKDFVELSFDHTPMVASLAVLSQMQSEIARTESKVISRLAEKVGAGQLKFDKV
ncbi:MAG: gliding motility protein GldM, partial [Bacteroidetes bacterium]